MSQTQNHMHGHQSAMFFSCSKTKLRTSLNDTKTESFINFKDIMKTTTVQSMQYQKVRLHEKCLQCHMNIQLR